MSEDTAATLAAGNAAGVVQFVHVGCSKESHASAVALAQAHPEVFAVVGIHPHEASSTDAETLADLEAMTQSPRVVAIGETGLDYFYDRSSREEQRRSMREHLTLSRRLNLPVVLHIRDAHQEALQIARETPGRDTMPGMVHCFTAGPTEAKAWLDLGYHLSFSGIATFPKCDEIRDAVRMCPSDRILLETDAPYLSPVPVRGRGNQPANVAFTCVRLAAVREQTPAKLATLAADNTRALLALPPPAPITQPV